MFEQHFRIFIFQGFATSPVAINHKEKRRAQIHLISPLGNLVSGTLNLRLELLEKKNLEIKFNLVFFKD